MTKKEPKAADIPSSLQHMASLKWTTLEALRVLQERLGARGLPVKVLLLTACGVITGRISEFSDDYETSVAPEVVDTASATVHLRTDLWRLFMKSDEELKPSDSAAVIRITDGTIHSGHATIAFGELAVFASDVCAYGLLNSPTELNSIS